MAGTPGAATYVKTTSGSIITVVPKSLATLGGKIISSNIVSGRHMSFFFFNILGLNSQASLYLFRLFRAFLWVARLKNV